MTCLCINPDCPEPERPDDEHPCKACGADLLLKGRYRTTGILSQNNKITIIYDLIDLKNSNRPQVLKVLYTANQETIARFSLEADFLSNHQILGIPAVEKGGYFSVKFPSEEIPAYCLVMEKINGINLEQWIKKQNGQKLSERKAIDWLVQLVTILNELHKNQYLHRDIKPSNIMLQEEENRLFLIDLGAVGSSTRQVLNGATVTLIGTYGYMPPEQLRGKLSFRSDFYALGRTFVHLLTGKEPSRLYEDPPGKLLWKQEAPSLTKDFTKLIDHLIVYEEQNRPEKATDILSELLGIERRAKEIKTKPSFSLFKIVFGAIVLGSVGFLGFLALRPNTQISPPISSPTPLLSPSQIHPCKIRQETQNFDEDALAKDVLDYLNNRSIKDIQKYNINQTHLTINHVKQFKFDSEQCDLLINATFENEIPLDETAKQTLKNEIKQNFQAINHIRIDP